MKKADQLGRHCLCVSGIANPVAIITPLARTPPGVVAVEGFFLATKKEAKYR